MKSSKILKGNYIFLSNDSSQVLERNFLIMNIQLYCSTSSHVTGGNNNKRIYVKDSFPLLCSYIQIFTLLMKRNSTLNYSLSSHYIQNISAQPKVVWENLILKY